MKLIIQSDWDEFESGIYTSEAMPTYNYIIQSLKNIGIINFEEVILVEHNLLISLKKELLIIMKELLLSIDKSSKKKANLVIDGLHYNLNCKKTVDASFNSLNIVANLIENVILNEKKLGVILST